MSDSGQEAARSSDSESGKPAAARSGDSEGGKTALPLAAASERMRALARARWTAEARAKSALRRQRRQEMLARHAPAPRTTALTRDDLSESQRRELFDLAVAELKAQLQATLRQPVVQRGTVVGHVDVPDNNARLKAIAETFVFLGSRSAGRASGASAPTKLQVNIASFAAPGKRPPAVVDVTPREVGASEG